MRIDVPLFVETRRQPGQPGDTYTIRPLFFEQPVAADRSLARATARLAKLLRDTVQSLAKNGRHHEAANFAFHPDLTLQRVDLRLDLRQTSFQGRLSMVTFRHLNRRLAFCPHLLDVWFELQRNESLAQRAAEVYQRQFRQWEKDGEDFSHLKAKSQAWLSTLELDVNMSQSLFAGEASFFSLFGAQEQFNGATELSRVGRCLDWLHPDGLDQAWHRRDEVRRLAALLKGERRPVLLVGQRQVGKTAVIHETVRRRVKSRKSSWAPRRNVWLVSPQRLISGMSYVGQWEGRLLAILKHVQKHDHTLYFDDLLGLFRAGVSASSSHSVADVLKPYVERRDVRVLGEITPEQLRVLRERDRGLADMFHIVRIEPPDEETALRMLLSVVRRLESRHRCRFGLSAMPLAVDLANRYLRDAAMPGKAARLLTQMAVKHPGKTIGRPHALLEFHDQTGLNLRLLDQAIRLGKQTVISELSQAIVGQQAALDAMSDVVTVAKAQLNDPARPLGSLLFLGPTGVGKTESAKALAKFLYGDEAKLLRFDMNECVSAHAAARLAGTFDQPEGLLTSEVRRAPFSVILLDEIEKAHPDVFDLLLQVLGEGRLTDGLGRTADFAGTVIIMTSNLGAREASGRVGFERAVEAENAAYTRAAEDFFRPEFFNRLDRIVPFTRLSNDELGRIADMVLGKVVAREGLVRRRCAMRIDRAARDWLIEKGTHPALGARAMKRAVEQELVQPVSCELASIRASLPTVLEIDRRESRICVKAVGLTEAPRIETEICLPDDVAPESRLREILSWLREESRRVAELRPEGEIKAGEITAPQYQYMAYTGFLQRLRDDCRRVEEMLQSNELDESAFRTTAPQRQRRLNSSLLDWNVAHARILAEFCAAQDMHEYLNSLFAGARSEEDEIRYRLQTLTDLAALARTIAPASDGWSNERVLIAVKSLDDASRELRSWLTTTLMGKFTFVSGGYELPHLDATGASEMDSSFAPAARCFADAVKKRFEDQFGEPIPLGFAGELPSDIDLIELEGHAARRLTACEQGTHLFVCSDGRLAPMQVFARPLTPDESVEEVCPRMIADADETFRWRPIVRLYDQPQQRVVDLRTGVTGSWSHASLAGMYLSICGRFDEQEAKDRSINH